MWLTTPTAHNGRLQTIMVAACHAGTGSTTTASMLAATLAAGKKSRVLIIDGNFRTPSLNRVFKVKNNGGLTETVFAENPFEVQIQLTDRENLFVLTTGRLSLIPTEVFEGESIDQLLFHLKQKFDFIIFDAAPLLEFPDAYALAPKVDTIVIVVEADKTPIDGVQRVKRDLERVGGRILGVVLNRQKEYVPAFLRKFIGSM
ncbi:MAG: CpsD/CapB family tyrosine-protein kinase [Candidatus Binatia bacterium]